MTLDWATAIHGEFTVSAVEAKPTRRNPPPPFTTSTLQQEGGRKLGMSAQQAVETKLRAQMPDLGALGLPGIVLAAPAGVFCLWLAIRLPRVGGAR